MESRTKKKLGTAIGGVAAVGAAISLTAGTFSYFTDTDTSEAQTVKTGNISVGQSIEQGFPDTNWSPGDSQEATYMVTNNGNVPGDLTLAVKDAGGNTSLKNALEVSVGNSLVGSLKHVEDLGPQHVMTLAPGASQKYTVTVHLPNSGNQNSLQNKSASVKVVATLQTP